MNGSEIGRRSFLRAGLATGALVVATPALRSRAFAAALLQQRHLAPVRVSRDRLIRTVVGLRPFRSEGFVVEAEKLREKLLVHNYGHGGAGFTLSWACAEEVCAIASRTS